MKVPEPRKLPSGVWFIQLRLGGESIPVTASTKKDCINAAALIKAEHKNGKLTVQQKKGAPTLREAINNRIESRTNILSPATIREYENVIRNRFANEMDMPIDKIKNWQTIVNKEAAMPVKNHCSPNSDIPKNAPTISAKTLKNAVAVVSSAYKFAGYDFPTIDLPQRIMKEHKWLRPSQLKTFVDATNGSAYRLPMLLALNGLRRSEIYALTWNNIDFENQIIKVRGAKVYNNKNEFVEKPANKTEKSRRDVPILIPALLEDLKSNQGSGEDHIVTCSANAIFTNINRICESNGWEKVGIHGLRHSFASLCYHLDIKEKTCAKWGGWTDGKVLHEIYTHLAEEDEEDDIEKVRKFMISE